MEEVKKAAETEFEHICGVAKQEVRDTVYPFHMYCVTSCLSTACVNMRVMCFYQIAHFHGVRVELLRQSLVEWCEKQLLTAKENADQFNQHLQAFRGLA